MKALIVSINKLTKQSEELKKTLAEAHPSKHRTLEKRFLNGRKTLQTAQKRFQNVFFTSRVCWDALYLWKSFSMKDINQ